MSTTEKTKSRKLSPPLTGFPAISPFRVASVWPHQEAPLLLTKVGPGDCFIATSFSPISFKTLENQPFKDLKGTENNLQNNPTSFPRWLVALPYETFESKGPSNLDQALAWNIDGGLLWREEEKTPIYVSRAKASSQRFHFSEQSLLGLLKEAVKTKTQKPQSLKLTPTISDDTYLECVQEILRSIKKGDFYQVNFLRFFHANKGLGWNNLCDLMEQNGGSQSTLIARGQRILACFSPERFVQVQQEEEGPQISTWPIKGTAPRQLNHSTTDEQVGESLLQCPKNRAELRMITDLMRNDLNQISLPGSVSIKTEASLKKCAHVWHLESEITGTLQNDLTLGKILSCLCPGGSITGAPKIAAMKHIHHLESEPRGFFMGNILRIDDDGSLYSNIMIRTLLSDDWMSTAKYAAGSGIVIKSTPLDELNEIKAKCRVITEVNS